MLSSEFPNLTFDLQIVKLFGVDKSTRMYSRLLSIFKYRRASQGLALAQCGEYCQNYKGIVATALGAEEEARKALHARLCVQYTYRSLLCIYSR